MTTPTLEKMMESVQQLGPEDFEGLVGWIVTIERERRKREASQEAAQARVVMELVQSGKIPGASFVSLEEAFAGAGVPVWVDPAGDITRMFPEGAVVSHWERFFMSTLEGLLNPAEPGTDGSWQDVTDEIVAANRPPEEQSEPAFADEPEYFSELPAPQVARDDELGLEDGESPPASGLDDSDPEPEPSV